MDVTFLQTLLASSQAPWLPDVVVARWALHGAWGVVLGAITWQLGRAFFPAWRGWLAAAVLGWALWPGPESPAFWLGLAFQSPSLMSVCLCVGWVLQPRRSHPWADRCAAGGTGSWCVLAGAGVVLGWVLLLDMLAWWPVSVYAWGFGSAALAGVVVLALLLWLAAGASPSGRAASLSLAAVLGVFVLTRLPSGNVWDALLDPWLWVLLQVGGAVVGLRRLVSARRW